MGETEVQQLFALAKAGDINGLKKLLDTKPRNDPIFNEVDSLGNSPVHYAVKTGKPRVVLYLIERGIDPNRQNHEGNTAAHIAVLDTQEGLAAWLIKKGADFTIKNKDDRSVFDLASKTLLNSIKEYNNFTATFASGLPKSTPAKITPNSAKTAMTPAPRSQPSNTLAPPPSAASTKSISDASVFVTTVSPRDMELLYNLAREGNLDKLQAMISEKKPNIEAKNMAGKNLLHIACENGRTEVVRYLLTECNSNPDCEEEYSNTPLLSACVRGFADIVDLLASNGANVNKKSMFGHTPLMLASEFGHNEIVERLLFANANLFDTDKHGNTALHIAVKAQKISTAKFIIENSIRTLSKHNEPLDTILKKNNQGESIVDLGGKEIHDFLVEKGVLLPADIPHREHSENKLPKDLTELLLGDRKALVMEFSDLMLADNPSGEGTFGYVYKGLVRKKAAMEAAAKAATAAASADFTASLDPDQASRQEQMVRSRQNTLPTPLARPVKTLPSKPSVPPKLPSVGLNLSVVTLKEQPSVSAPPSRSISPRGPDNSLDLLGYHSNAQDDYIYSAPTTPTSTSTPSMYSVSSSASSSPRSPHPISPRSAPSTASVEPITQPISTAPSSVTLKVAPPPPFSSSSRVNPPPPFLSSKSSDAPFGSMPKTTNALQTAFASAGTIGGSGGGALQRGTKINRTVSARKAAEKGVAGGAGQRQTVNLHMMPTRNTKKTQIQPAAPIGPSFIAVKKLLVGDNPPAHIIESFRREVNILSHLESKYVVRLMGVCTKLPNLCIVTEWAESGNLASLASKIKLTAEQIVKIGRRVTKGLIFLHENNVIHADMKASNILVFRNLKAKIGDLGLARSVGDTSVTDAGRGSMRWLAPEVQRDESAYSTKVDVFGFGLMMSEMITGTVPFPTLSPTAAAAAMMEGKRPALPANIPTRLSDLIRRCWDASPNNRPDAATILADLDVIRKLMMNIKFLNSEIKTFTV